MTKEEQNRAIAQACGVVECNEGAWTPLIAGASMIKSAYCTHDNCVPVGMLPNYTDNLNAIHDAEMTLNLNLFSGREFRKTLVAICPNAIAIHATAAQRAEAFLKAIGKWIE